ncbi:MAG: hypothetical protein JW724_06665 [Candidatus Altiarchaeota archaeon]|nr:hypothetical protein [Candidatus Altiarchaeota archaeon]
MDKRIVALVALTVIALAAVVYLGGTGPEKPDASQNPLTRLKEEQIVACNAADASNSCDTKLPRLVGLVTKDDCCKSLGKCC